MSAFGLIAQLKLDIDESRLFAKKYRRSAKIAKGIGNINLAKECLSEEKNHLRIIKRIESCIL